jgi:cobalt-precorrin 5A hydrolase
VKVALITLCNEGALVAGRIRKSFADADMYVHSIVTNAPDAKRFDSIVSLTREIFSQYRGLVYVAPCGVVVRALAANIESKYTDPAVVVVDVGGRFAVSLLSGHEGGANELTVQVANAIDAEPMISTTTEAVKL